MMSASTPTLFSILCFMICFKPSTSFFCPLIERQSLLSFKHSLQDPYHHLSSWDDDNDGEGNCCKWNGVVCNNSTGHVDQLHLDGLSLRGQINPSLLNLKHLTHLDLSLNNFQQSIPPFFGLFTKIQYLNLSFAGFHGNIPHNIGNLSSLRTLDLDGYLLNVDHSLKWLSGLSKLEYLNMNHVDISTAKDWLQVINTLPSLQQLRLQNCSLDYISPLNYVNLTSLTRLDLSSNHFDSLAIPTWIFGLNNLLYLNLSYNSFIGPIPTSSNTTKLQNIDLSSNFLNSTIPSWLYSTIDLESVHLDYNFLHGTLPPEFTNLCKIRVLSLWSNNFRGKMLDSFGNMSECFLQGLEVLDVGYNQLSGYLTDDLGEFKSLRSLELMGNSLSGKIPVNLGKLSSLEYLSLCDNKFSGNVPYSLGELYNLETLDISYNKLEGVVTQNFFGNFTKLKGLYASDNELTLKVDQDWIPPFQLEALTLSTWNLGTGSQIPSWLEMQKNLSTLLGLSNTGISGIIPSWFWKIQYLNLSHNHLHGKIPDINGSNLYIYLSSNQFKGPLPRIGDNLIELDLSNNSFSGGISHFLCDDTYHTYSLRILHLGDNFLSGELPDCWTKFPHLEYLNIGNNQMFGSIPTSVGFLSNLLSLNLHNNNFSGKIPFSIHNCTKLVKMGLADNNLDGNIPMWMGRSLVELRILILRSNNLSGDISSDICELNYLQILDLSDNKLSGMIPRCLHNFTAMDKKSRFYSYHNYMGYFTESAAIVKKGSLLEYDTILGLVTSIDLSINNLSGKIPNEITRLLELGSLNLSRNYLSGSIPRNIGDMKKLESLDLSRNSLSGPIPMSLARISGLGYLDLSYNNLTGKIPQGTQLQSFDASSYIGNSLCGAPLISNCSGDGNRINGGEEEEKNEKDAEIGWFYVLLSLGYAVGLSMVCSVLVLKKSWRDAYFGWVESMCVYAIVKWRRFTKASAPTS